MIEWKKIICLKGFFWFKQKDLFELNNSNICLIKHKQIIAFVYGLRYDLFDLKQKFIRLKTFFILFKDTLFQPNKFYLIQMNHFFESKKVSQTNNFLWFNQIFFLNVDNYRIYMFE